MTKRISNEQSIAYRAIFSTRLCAINSNFTKTIKSAEDLYNAIPAEIKSAHGTTIRKQYLFDMMSALEIIFTDSLFELLMSYPSKIRTETLSVDHLADSNSISQIIRIFAEKIIHTSSYAKPIVHMGDVYKYFDAEIANNEFLDTVIEAKATRDIYMHNNGKANSIYFQKTGLLKRVDLLGSELALNDEYLSKVKNAVVMVGTDFVDKCHTKYKHNTPANIFKDMWTSSSLNEVQKFEEQWELFGDSVHKNDKTWGWSGSERLLFNFFKLIQGGRSGNDDANINDIPDALNRWKGFPDEKLITSWLDSPFYL